LRIFVAESLKNHTEIELISGKVGLFQEAINEKLFKEAKTLEQCDSILVPHDAFHFNQYSDYLKYLNQLSAKKPLIYSDRGDFPKKPKIINSVALRVAINPGESTKNKIVVPYNVESLSYLPLRHYAPSPVISFMGFMPHISPQRILQAGRQSPTYPIQGNGAVIRRISHKALLRSGLDYRFVLRNSYGALESKNVLDNRAAYLEILSESDYVSSPRGDANQSARFYETLSAGRIPLIRNSSMHQPSSLVSSGKTISPGLTVPTLAANLHKKVMENWLQIGDSNSYRKQQLELREYYEREVSFIPFMRRMFLMDFSDFLLCAR
jgi:hypothetical protein